MDERVYSKEIVEFVTVGVEFCGWVERSAETDRRNFLLTLTRILPLLYLKASLLPADETLKASLIGPLPTYNTSLGEVSQAEALPLIITD